MKKIKAGIIGVGGIAQQMHIPSYKNAEEVEITAIADINEARLKTVAEKFDIPKTFTNWEKMLEEDIDVVTICSPNFFHAQQSIKAMEAGKHVLCEKPLCLTEKEVEEVFATSEKTKMKFMGAMPRRFSGAAKILKPMIESGELGEIYYMKTNYLRRRGIPGLGTWFTRKELSGGGPMIDVGVHTIDFMIYITGIFNPEIIVGATYSHFQKNTAGGENWPPPERTKKDGFIGEKNVEDLAAGFVKFASGATLFIEASWAGNSKTGSSTSILGTKAGIQMPDPKDSQNPVRIYSEKKDVLLDIVPIVPQAKVFQEEVDHFLKCVREDLDTGTKKEEILTVTRIIDGIYKSAELGKPILY